MQSVADVLEKAADLIAAPGAWTQGQWGDSSRCMCAEGAIYFAAGSHPMRDCVVADRACDVMATLVPATMGNAIADWNDAPGRTQAEVVAKLLEAAAPARSGGA